MTAAEFLASAHPGALDDLRQAVAEHVADIHDAAAEIGYDAWTPDTEVRYVVIGKTKDGECRYASFESRVDAEEWMAAKQATPTRYTPRDLTLWVQRVDTWPLVPVDEVTP
ncbi:MAG TPA: hypothetical protein VK059_14915 [Nocardioidaceae bacterium]|nr:hypothetical protein [Nocardioidaceae bacterium]